MSQGYNPYFESSNRPLGKTKVQFSKIELQHLGIAVFALTVAFAAVLGDGTNFASRLQLLFVDQVTLVAAFLAVSSGFVLHELAHKVVAIKYGCVAEFRAQLGGLGLSVLIALGTSFLFAAPGAVQIYGRINKRENGIISIAGPATNIAIAIAAIPLVIFLEGAGEDIFATVGYVNAILGAFNLLPFGPLDGKKVMAWSPIMWGAALLTSVALWLAVNLSRGLAL
jgi:Zn-dependent protease